MAEAAPVMRPLSGISRVFAALQGRLYTAPPVTISTVDPQNWPSANQPVQPIAPPGAQPLQFSFWEGLNLNITPRPDAALTFANLRDLATYPLARICIENVKDSIATLPWAIRLKGIPGQSAKERKRAEANDEIIPRLTEFFSYPDGETPWKEWVRPLMEDMLVIDAGSILVQQTLSGQVVRLRVPDGTQFLRLIDDQGYTPRDPNPAYTQLWDGIPRVLLTQKQLVYRPSNIAPSNSISSQLYGRSITEQLAPEIRIGQERLNFVLAYYTQGAVPGLVHVVPAGVLPDQVKTTMQWMNSELAGNLAARRQWRMIQGFSDGEKGDQIIQLKDPVLADIFDDLHIRKIAFGYGTSPQRLLKQMNRASAEAGQDAAEKEGIAPRLAWLKGTIDLVIQRRMGYAKYEMVWDTQGEPDPVKQANINKIYVDDGIRTRDEVREDLGDEPLGLPETTQPTITTPNGPVPLAGAIERAEEAHQAAIAPKPAPVIAGAAAEAKPEPVIAGAAAEAKPEPEESQKKKIVKGLRTDHLIRLDPDRQTRTLIRAKKSLKLKIETFFKAAAEQAVSVPVPVHKLHVVKEAPPPNATADEIEEYIDSLMNAIDWDSLIDIVLPELKLSGLEGAQIGIRDMKITDRGLINSLNAGARDYASDRAAEMVGKKWIDGKLVDNPDAKWAITDSTRDMLRRIVTQAFTGETPMAELQQAIQDAGALSEERAELIARSEVSMAQVGANYQAWLKNGTVLTVKWLVSGDHDKVDECDLNVAAGEVPIGSTFPTGNKHAPAHPSCNCMTIPGTVKGVKL